MQTPDKILLGHGSGGKLMHDLIENIFGKYFIDNELASKGDAAILPFNKGLMAFTTDAFVVQPLFFNGGDIGKLAVCGTVNDLVAAGAEPLFLSASFIIEEGLEIAILEKVVASMAVAAAEAGVRIVCGDTKVVGKSQCDKLFITTSGVGKVNPGYQEIVSRIMISPGDFVLLSGSLGDHGMAVLAARNELGFASSVKSDCASLNKMIQPVLDKGLNVKFMRDPTRGGLASALCEIVQGQPFGLVIEEDKIPVHVSVTGMCELYGYDPLYLANEGKMLIIASENHSDEVLSILQQTGEGKEANIIGRVIDQYPGKVLLKTKLGGNRYITMLAGEQLPRIC